MLRAIAVTSAGRWSPSQANDSVVLDFDARHRRRVVMRGGSGEEFLLDLPRAAALRDGDGLLLENGSIVAVVAAPERLIEVRAEDGAHLLRLAWHLGNRHLPTQVLGRALRVREDHVIRRMLEGLGARVLPIEAPFEPESGAYGHGHIHERHDTAAGHPAHG